MSTGTAGRANTGAGRDRVIRAQGPLRRRGPHGPGHGVPVEKPAHFWPSARRLFRLFLVQRLKVAAVLLLAVGGTVASVLGPKVLGMATDVVFDGFMGTTLAGQFPPGTTIDQAITRLRSAGETNMADMLAAMNVTVGVGIDFSALATILMWVVVLYLGASVLQWAQAYLLNFVVQDAMLAMRAEVERKINRLPLRYFDAQPRGELLSRVTNDIDNISQAMLQALSQLLGALLTVVGVVTMMVIISPLLALISLIAIPLTIVITALIAKRSQGRFVDQWRLTGDINSQVEEAFTGHALVNVYGQRAATQQRFDSSNDHLYEASFRAQFISGTIMPATRFIGNLTYVLVAVVGGLRVASGSMSLGDVQAFIQYSRQFTMPLSQVAGMVNVLQSGVASAERVFDLFDAEEESPEAVPTGTIVIPTAAGRGQVTFEHVSFSYAPDEPLIEDLSLQVRPGQTIAIVGPTGAGKTTLVNLVMRFYELDAGRITLDGVDITAIPRGELRAQTGMVLQDTWLFGGTIRDNIRYGRLDATDEEVLAAARATYVDQFVRALPDGYDTVIDEDAGNLSAGQQQLITIARAFLADPALLILDEATSSVDTRTELLVQRAMASLRSGRTSFVIAHRLSTIRDADVILVMERGAIVEQGSHTELLAADGAYAALYRSQFSAPVDEGV